MKGEGIRIPANILAKDFINGHMGKNMQLMFRLEDFKQTYEYKHTVNAWAVINGHTSKNTANVWTGDFINGHTSKNIQQTFGLEML